GFPVLRRSGIEKDTYSMIVTGFAPGGVVVIWLYGGGKQVEVGRYQGKKTTVPASEIDRLDNHERLLFDPVNRKLMMENDRLIPVEVQAANKNRPIPFGLWDRYRKKYCWRPTFIMPEGGKMDDHISFHMFNGENTNMIGDVFTENNYEERAIPDDIGLGWWDKYGQGYGGGVDFDEKEIFAAFAEVFKDSPQGTADLEIRVNQANTLLMVSLKGNGKSIPLSKIKIKAIESRSLTKEYKYNWRPVFIFPEGEKMLDQIDFSSKTSDQFLTGTTFLNMAFQQNGTPSTIDFVYYKGGSSMDIRGIGLDFEQKEIAQTFQSIEQLSPGSPIEMEIKIGKGYHTFTVTLKGNGEELPVKFRTYDFDLGY
ncbi:DUF2931 family protein, partial [Mariniflexile ostreae]